MSKQPLLAACVLAALSLSACENVQADMNKSFSGIQQAFSNFHPFDNVQPINQVAAAEPVKPLAPLSAAEKAESDKLTAGKTTTTTSAGSKTQVVASASAPSSSSDSTCPNVRIVQDLNQVHQFVEPSSPSPAQSISSVKMESIESKCNIAKNNMAIDMTVAFEGSLGSKARAQPGDKPSFAYPYFVAITNNQGSIVAKEVFAVTMNYDGSKNREAHSEQIRQLIPLKDKDYKNYKILVGFQLTDQELAYNRTMPPEVASTPNPVTLIEPAAGGGTVITSPTERD